MGYFGPDFGETSSFSANLQRHRSFHGYSSETITESVGRSARVIIRQREMNGRPRTSDSSSLERDDDRSTACIRVIFLNNSTSVTRVFLSLVCLYPWTRLARSRERAKFCALKITWQVKGVVVDRTRENASPRIRNRRNVFAFVFSIVESIRLDRDSSTLPPFKSAAFSSSTRVKKKVSIWNLHTSPVFPPDPSNIFASKDHERVQRTLVSESRRHSDP